MDEDTIDYQGFLLSALRDVPRRALRQVAESGLPGEHHFFLTFRTAAPGVEIPRFLTDEYPEEMTIILQKQFWNLDVDDQGFAVDLRFGGKMVRLAVPFAALSQFADPAADFGLRFDALPVAAQGPTAPLEPPVETPAVLSPSDRSASEILRFDPKRRR
jgi:hypothetical protein